MEFDATLRLTELLLSLAVIQRGLEHLGRDTRLFLPQIAVALPVLAGVGQAVALPVLWGLFLAQLWHFKGPYNGGSEKMLMLVLTCLTVARLAPDAAELAMAYLAVQLVLSYVVSGGIKIVNPAWRSGEALGDVFALSFYPVSRDLRALAGRRALLWAGSWGVMVFEVAFPVALLSGWATLAALGLALAFHLSNAVLFGLNRFVWAWIAAYPSLIWAQDRVLG